MYTLEGLLKNSENVTAEINGKWVPARPVHGDYIITRIKDAWAVLTKKADAFTWPEGQ